MQCKKCGRTLDDCPACNGGRGSGHFVILRCSRCDNTGLVCVRHAGFWR